MRFFNQKEEVINIELTSYGKEQFSIGEFSPVFYSFYDGSILYDGEYGKITERQNQISNRISNETPRIKPNTRFTSTPGSVFSLSSVRSQDYFSQDKIWNAQYYRTLGSSDPNSTYYPSWKILPAPQADGTLNDGVVYLCDNTIPQMSATLHVDYITEEVGDTSVYVLENVESLIFSVEEINTVFKNNGNFDIEVFVSGSDNIDTVQFINTNSDNSGFLMPQLSPGVLLDTIRGVDTDINQFFPVLNDTYVEYHLNIHVDGEISLSPETVLKSSLYGSQIVTEPQSICDEAILEDTTTYD